MRWRAVDYRCSAGPILETLTTNERVTDLQSSTFAFVLNGRTDALLFLGSFFEDLHNAPVRDDAKLDALAMQMKVRRRCSDWLSGPELKSGSVGICGRWPMTAFRFSPLAPLEFFADPSRERPSPMVEMICPSGFCAAA
jgi:hypothetical protein